MIHPNLSPLPMGRHSHPALCWTPADAACAHGTADGVPERLEVAAPDGNTIDLGYVPRDWALIVHQWIAEPETRGIIMVVARQHGKTHLCCILLIIAALYTPGDYAYVAPRRVTAKGVAWPILKQYASGIPGAEFREGDIQVKIPNAKHKTGFSTIHLFGAQDEDTGGSGRGYSLTGIVADELGQISKSFIDDVLMPTQTAIEKPFFIGIGTARGQSDALYQMLEMAQRTPGWHALIVPITTAGVFDQQRQDDIRSTISDNAWRREYLCDFGVGTEDQVVSTEHVIAAQARTLPELLRREYLSIYPLVAGLDIGLQRDKSVLTVRCGPAVIYTSSWDKPSVQDLALGVHRIMREWDVDSLFVDVGHSGRAVCDVMRGLGMTPIEINFGGSPDDKESYANKRSEMWFRMADWITRDDCVLPPDHAILRELTGPRFDTNATNKLQLEKKKDVIARTGSSPDFADSLCLTFASKWTPNPRLVGDMTTAHRSLSTTGDELVGRAPDGSRYSSARRTALHKAAHRSDEYEEFDPFGNN
jgi:hypothetical protein